MSGRFRADPAWRPGFCADGPWFDAIAAAAAPFAGCASWPTVEAIDAALAPAAGVRFVTAAPRPRRQRRRPDIAVDPGALYEGQVAGLGVVPTRPRSWHDLFNALVWASFPRAKRVLTARLDRAQRARLAPEAWKLPGERSREQDLLALIDEGGLLVGGGVPLVFGHALFEHLVSGVWTPRAALVALEIGDDRDEGGTHRGSIAAADAALAAALDPALASPPLLSGRGGSVALSPALFETARSK